MPSVRTYVSDTEKKHANLEKSFCRLKNVLIYMYCYTLVNIFLYIYINTHKCHSYLKNVFLHDSQGAQERQPRTQHSDMDASNQFLYMNKTEKGNGFLQDTHHVTKRGNSSVAILSWFAQLCIANMSSTNSTVL